MVTGEWLVEKKLWFWVKKTAYSGQRRAYSWMLDTRCSWFWVLLTAESAELAEKKSVVGLGSVLPVAVGQAIVKMVRRFK